MTAADAAIAVPAGMRSWPLRLVPGDDLRRALEHFALTRLPHGGFVVCGIGSLTNPRLRLADADEATAYAGPHEIVSLQGTLTPQGAHLHMAVASAAGTVAGGHVVYGNVVRTTAELLLVDVPGWALMRGHDAATGFAELAYKPASSS